MTTNEALQLILENLDDDINLYEVFGFNRVDEIGLPKYLGIDEFALAKEQMLFLLEIEEEQFDKMFGPRISKRGTINAITCYLHEH